MDLYTPSTDSGLFNLLGKLFALGRAVDAARTGNVLTKRQIAASNRRRVQKPRRDGNA
ncbi:hypothetical protein [Thermogutta sp.]|uniref:hypothetical protein n=1 Tax=Thermogutta sp. TaxID=1962930 RepID=UPI00321FA6A2